MNPSTPSAPEPADWLAGLLRGLHPLRWALCLVGLALTGLGAAAAQSWFDGEAPRWEGWFQQPAEHARELGAEIAGRSLGGAIVRLGPLLALVAAAWCLVGGWIARHELLARLRSRPATDDLRLEPGPTALVVRRRKDLLLCCLLSLLITLLTLLPVVIAGRVNDWFGGFGAVLVSLFLPVLLVASGLLLLLVFGGLAWPLMPVALAAECSDLFDALSRAYNYALQRPLRFLLLTAVTLVLAGVPLAAALFALAGPLPGWTPAARQALLWLAAGLSASLFWSLQTLVYLHLRAAVDGEGAATVAVEPLPAGKPKTLSRAGKTAAESPGDTDPPGILALIARTVQLLALAAGAWWLTAWLFGRVGGEQAGWLAWGLGETFVPPATGLYRVASVIAAFWGAIGLLVTLRMAVRGPRQGEAPRR